MTYEIRVAQLQAQPGAVVRDHVTLDRLPAFLGDAFADVARTLAGQGLEPTGPPFGQYRPTDDGGFDVEVGFPTSRPARPEGRVETTVLPGGEAAFTVHRGRYEDVGAAYSAATDWMTDNGYRPVGEAWEVYLDDPLVTEPRTEVFIPCQSAHR